MALQTIELLNLESKNILKEFTERDMNKMINFIGHQINYNLKCCVLNYFKNTNDKTKYKYTKITTPKKNGMVIMKILIYHLHKIYLNVIIQKIS